MSHHASSAVWEAGKTPVHTCNSCSYSSRYQAQAQGSMVAAAQIEGAKTGDIQTNRDDHKADRAKGYPKNGYSLKESWRATVVHQVHSMFHCFFTASVVTGSCKKVELKLKQAGQCLQHNVKRSFYSISIGQLHLNGCIVFPDALALEFKPRRHSVIPRQLISLMVQKSF